MFASSTGDASARPPGGSTVGALDRAVRQHPAAGWQPSLFGSGAPTVDPALTGLRRCPLDQTSWIDHLPGWLTGADAVFAELAHRLPWQARTVRMYDRVVDEPRLTWWWSEGDGPLPLPVLAEARTALAGHYGCPFASVGANCYRDGRDSVAWHGDRERHRDPESLVAIVSVGEPRPFLVRPRGGGASRAWLLGHGDLLVMGGTCQRHWEHTVPKVAVAGPRISVVFRRGTAR